MKKLHRILASFLLLPTLVVSQMTPTYVVDIPTRDSLYLAADVYVPDNCTSCPTILIQTPYNKDLFRWSLPLGTGVDLQNSNFSWVVVDWRGFYGSLPAFTLNPNRGEDGYDVLQWISEQSWNNGKVGTWGPSALGGIQYQTMREHHPAHTCAVPLVAHPQQGYNSYFYGGVLEAARVESLDLLGFGVSGLILANPYYNLIWQFAEEETWYPEEVHIPTLQIGGWYDHNINTMMDWYQATRQLAEASVQDQQWLLVGPWVHGGTGAAHVGSAIQGELSYANAAFKNDTMALAFFDHYLLNAINGWENTPGITYYEPGRNVWNSSTASSIEHPDASELLFDVNGLLGTNPGTGSSSFLCDPTDPSPTIGGQNLNLALEQGPFDQISLDGRSDVISFASDLLPGEVNISGRVKANLFVECDQPDADVVVRLVDVYPDGRNMLINDGIRRMRFRNGFTENDEEFMLPGQVYEVEVTLPFTNYTWKEGHRIKAFISGNSATRWDVNLQNGGTMYTAGDSNLANITIHHGAMGQSKLTLPGNIGALSTEEIEVNDQVAVYPNPSTGQFYIASALKFSTFTVFDLVGQTIAEGPFEERIDLSYLKPGPYLLRLQAANGMVTKRICLKTGVD